MMNNIKTNLLLLLMISLVYSQLNIDGGNTTQTTFTIFSNSTYWDGVYGNVLLGNGVVYNHTVTGNNITEINIIAQNPPCIYNTIKIHIIAVNSSNIFLPLKAGNLSILDSLISGTENGTNTFKNITNFTLTYGTYNNVPTTYTYVNNTSSDNFRIGYLNDANNNIVFVAEVVNDKPGWNGSLNDYQIMLPKGTAAMNYTIRADVNYTCQQPGTKPTEGKKHKIEIEPLPDFTAIIGQKIKIPVTVKNSGDYYIENDVDVYLDCISYFDCTSYKITKLYKGQPENVNLTLIGHKVGTYVLVVHAKNAVASSYNEFKITIVPECIKDEECNQFSYCEEGLCKPKKDFKEKCKRREECKSGLCENEECVLCKKDSDCAENEVCEMAQCKKIICECGYIQNHRCNTYECCKDSDCPSNKNCVSNKCVQKELQIKLIEGETIEGNELLIQIINNKGEFIPYANVFTSEMQTIADENGFTRIKTPYDGMIIASKEGYPQSGVMLPVIRLGRIDAAKEAWIGERVIIKLVDTKGKPIEGAVVSIDGKKYETDKNGEIIYIPDTVGEKIIIATKAGYIIKKTSIKINEEAKAMCYFPMLLNWFAIAPSYYVLWVITIILAIFGIFIIGKRLEWGKLKRVIYYSLPIILSLPSFWVFNICVMSNIAILQFIFSLVILILKESRNKNKENKKSISSSQPRNKQRL